MYIVIEKFDRDYPMIVTEYGTDIPLAFATKEGAEVEAEQCQDGQVVELT